jgi:adenine phosphoribosyltransferase
MATATVSVEDRLKSVIRDVKDFPKPGILFKDITPILLDHSLCLEVTDALFQRFIARPVEAVVGVESRGFLFGMMLAQKFEVPFIPVRKKGKLPYQTVSYSYDLEYGSATIEMHKDAVSAGQNILIHDDLLATGGTAGATAELIKKQGGIVTGFSFLIELEFLKGRDQLKKYSDQVISLISYS